MGSFQSDWENDSLDEYACCHSITISVESVSRETACAFTGKADDLACLESGDTN